ncbi:Signal peptidase I [invertebrate metagenome]|uniref:signal peptidase I n=1 Tax=invertebrate metagenome TaxID=1711999 RepID=A0A484H8V9_9ZZZZ
MKKKRAHNSSLNETIKTVFYATLIALVVRIFAFEPFNIPSGSMLPTLLVGDYLFVSKYSYGYSHHALPFSLPLFSGRILADVPQRGDVAVFKVPTDNKTDYVKRVIGLPGDSIQVVRGILHINGLPVRRDRIEDFVAEDGDGRIRVYTQYIEVLPNDVRHRIIELSDTGPLDNTREFVLPEDHYFVMGDNRDNSTDSRSIVGYVPFENFVGRADVFFFSVDNSAHLWEIWKWPWAIRFARLFSCID